MNFNIFKILLLIVIFLELILFGFLFFREIKQIEISLLVPAEIFNIAQNTEKKESSFFDPAVLNWESATLNAPWSKRDAHTALVFNDKIWLFGGVGGSSPDYTQNKGDIWVSDDGESWTLITENASWGPKRAHTSVVFQGKMWILGGVGNGERYKNDVWRSNDGIG